jgi:dCMP deaminase
MQNTETFMRISRHQMFAQIAQTVAQRSTCYRLNVGAVLVQDNNIVSIGYNGAPSGEPHCQGNDCPLSSSGGCTRAIHAEANAIKRCVNRYNTTHLYVTDSPCLACAKYIVGGSGITRVFYEREYRITEGIDYLRDYGIGVYRLTPAGYIVDKHTGLIVDENLKPQV